MRTRNPAHRYKDVMGAFVAPKHMYERSLWIILNRHTTEDDYVPWAFEIFSERFEREIFQAWLVARATDADIEKWLRIPPLVTQIYRHLFFDIETFRDELDLLSWVKEYENDKQGTAFGAQLLRDAIQNGLEKLCWTFGHNTFIIDPETVKQRTMTDMYMRSLAGRGHSITSGEANAALAHGNSALRAAQLVGRTTTPDAQAFLLKLRYREMTETATTVAQKEEILH